MDNFNIDKQTIDKLNSMLNNGNLTDMLSQIPPDTLKNFSSIMNGNISSNEKNNATNETHQNSESLHSANHSTDNVDASTFDFSKIDVNTIMKINSVMEKMNHSSDPRSNLLHSLKPYLRDEKKSKLDQYANLLNMANLMELFNQNNSKENSSD